MRLFTGKRALQQRLDGHLQNIQRLTLRLDVMEALTLRLAEERDMLHDYALHGDDALADALARIDELDEAIHTDANAFQAKLLRTEHAYSAHIKKLELDIHVLCMERDNEESENRALKITLAHRDEEIGKLRAMVADPIADQLADALHGSERELERCVQERDALKQQCTVAQSTSDAPQTATTLASDAPTTQSSKKAGRARRRAVEAVQATMAESEGQI